MSADFDPLTYEEVLINDAAACSVHPLGRKRK